MGDFSDKVVLITGAGRGIGRALALAFAAQGARVAANDITPINLDETLRLIRQSGGQAQDYVFDVAKKMPVQAMVDRIVQDWGRIDILINNAAVEPRSALLEMDEWDWSRTLEVNLSGPFFLMQTVGRLMRQQGGGVVVNLGAATGRAHGMEKRAAFIASKMGLIGLTREAARELGAYGIRVNAVYPEGINSGQDGQALHEPTAGVLAGREPGQPGDVVELVLFLCSPKSVDITGQAINVDGGRVMC